jgi:hypothetical protein
VSINAKAIIDDAQPYEGNGRGWPSEAIWQVHNLNNIDKHRLLLIPLAWVIVLFKANGIRSRTLGEIRGRTIFFSGSIGHKVEMEGEPTFLISLKDAGVFDCEEIVHLLDMFCGFIWNLILRFDSEFK